MADLEYIHVNAALQEINNGGIYTCKSCPYISKSNCLMKNHVRLHHLPPKPFNCSDKLSEIYFCADCIFRTDVLPCLTIHIEKYHNKSRTSNEENSFLTNMACKTCDFETYSTLHWLKHLAKCDQIRDREEEENEERSRAEESVENEHWFQREEFPNEYVVTIHMVETDTDSQNLTRLESKKHKFECTECDYKTDQKSNFNRHKIAKHSLKSPKGRTDGQNKIKCTDSYHETNSIKHTVQKHKNSTQNNFESHLKSADNMLEPSSTNYDVVDYLLNNSFNTLKYDEKLTIKRNGRARPSMPLLVMTGKNQKRGFNENNYDKTTWLTASTTRNRLYCWNCLLLSNEKSSVWAKIGYNNLQNLSRAIERHEKSQEHIFSSIKYEIFGKQSTANVLDSAHKRNIESFNEKVRENREILKRLIDVIVYLSTQEFVFRDETTESNKGSFKELIDFLKTYDPQLEKFLTEASEFVGNYESIQNDLIESISSVIKSKIQEELCDTDFFSWQIDETTDITGKSQLSVIFRYIVGGKIVERFIGFYDARKNSESLYQLLINEFQHFDLENKLIAQTYDGAAVESGDFNTLQTKIKNIAPRALFTPCYEHKMDLVLSKACNGIKEVRIFFSNLSGFSSFFSKSSKRSEVLNKIVDPRISSNAPIRWNFPSGAVFTVDCHRKGLIEVFNFILDREDFLYDNETLREAYFLKQLLFDSNFIFFLKVFKIIFEQTDVVFQILQDRPTDITYSKKRINSLIDQLKEHRNNQIHFSLLYSTFLGDTNETLTEEEETDNLRHKKRKTHFNFENKGLYYKQIFAQILDTIIVQLQTRFADLDVLQFFDLLNFDHFEIFSKEFPNSLLDKLIKQYPYFDHTFLKNELSVLYSDKALLGEAKSAKYMLSFIFSNNLKYCLPQLYKLLSLVLSIPVTSASVNRSFSALKRITNYNRSKMTQDCSLIAIEKHFVFEIKEIDNFYDSIIDHFANSQNRSLPLLYKSL